MMTHKKNIIYILIAIILFGCGKEEVKELDPEYLVNKFRVLGIQFEPPSLFTGEPSTLSLNLVNPDNIAFTSTSIIDPEENTLPTIDNGSIQTTDNPSKFLYNAPKQLEPKQNRRVITVEIQLSGKDINLNVRKNVYVYKTGGSFESDELNTNPTHQGINVKQGGSTKGAKSKMMSVEAIAEDKEQGESDFNYKWYAQAGSFETTDIKKTIYMCPENGGNQISIYSVIWDRMGGVAWNEKKVNCK